MPDLKSCRCCGAHLEAGDESLCELCEMVEDSMATGPARSETAALLALYETLGPDLSLPMRDGRSK